MGLSAEGNLSEIEMNLPSLPKNLIECANQDIYTILLRAKYAEDSPREKFLKVSLMAYGQNFLHCPVHCGPD